MKNLFTLIIVLCAFGFAVAQDVYYKETLDDGMPESWVVEGEWGFGNSATLSSQFFGIPDLGSNFAAFNDDGNGQTHIGDGTITTGDIDLTAVEGPLLLEMFSYFLNNDAYGDETAKVSVSTNGGKSFTEIADLDTSNGFEAISLDMAAYAGETVRLSFAYGDGGGWSYGWAIDEITFSSGITLVKARDYVLSAGASTILTEAQPGIEYIQSGFIINSGLDAITSYDVSITDGTETITTSFTGLNIERGQISKYTMDTPVIVEGNKELTVSITNVNGDMTPDANETDNSAVFNLNAYSALNENKGVLAEEATGTWCTFCPRGTVYLEETSKRFPDNFVGVAVHNQDPMVNDEYDTNLNAFPGFSGYPSVIFQRESIIDPDMTAASSLPAMNQSPIAGIEVGAELEGSELVTSVKVTFLEEVEGEYNVGIILTEDGVSGDADGYAQVNFYSGGAAGPMGGFELLPSPVPASFMVYDHVGRANIGGYGGAEGAIEGAYTVGAVDGWVFDSYSVPAEMNLDNVHIIGVLINGAGEIVNAKSASVLDAASNGLYSSVSTKDVFDNTLAEINPNPVQDIANISMNFENSVEVKVSVINSLGQTVSTRNFGEQSGNFQLQYDMANLDSGMYMMHITAGDKFITKKINKVK